MSSDTNQTLFASSQIQGIGIPHVSVPGGGTAITTDGSSLETNQTLLSSSHPTQIQGVGIPHVSVPGQLSQLMA